MKSIVVAAALLALTGCASNTILTRNGSIIGLQNDLRECEYDAVKYGAVNDSSMRTAIGAGIEEGLRRREVKLACMKSKGWIEEAG